MRHTTTVSSGGDSQQHALQLATTPAAAAPSCTQPSSSSPLGPTLKSTMCARACVPPSCPQNLRATPPAGNPYTHCGTARPAPSARAPPRARERAHLGRGRGLTLAGSAPKMRYARVERLERATNQDQGNRASTFAKEPEGRAVRPPAARRRDSLAKWMCLMPWLSYELQPWPMPECTRALIV